MQSQVSFIDRYLLTGTLIFSLITVIVGVGIASVLMLVGHPLATLALGLSLSLAGAVIFLAAWLLVRREHAIRSDSAFGSEHRVIQSRPAEFRARGPPRPLRGACDTCGKVEFMPFSCSRCGGVFCAEHRLPENHSCPFLYRP